MNSEEDTLPNNQTILDAIGNLQSRMDAKFDEVDKNFGEVNKRFQVIENRLEDMRLEMMSFDVRIDRLQAMSHENLNIAYGVRADIKVFARRSFGVDERSSGFATKAA